MRPGKTPICVFRFDDYFAANGHVVARILGLIERYRVPHTFGIIPHPGGLPFVRDTAGAERLRVLCDQELVEPALHGWNHEQRRLADGSVSEFEGLPFQAQLERIRNGKKILEDTLGRSIDTFIPPYNSYDELTLRACEESGVRIFSASFRRWADSAALRFLPQTAFLRSGERALREWRRLAGTVGDPTFLTIVYHSFEFKESGDPRGVYTLRQLEALFRTVSSTSDAVLLTLAGAAAQYASELSASRYQAGHWYYWCWAAQGGSMKRRCSLYDAAPPHFYYPESYYREMQARVAQRERRWPLWLFSRSGVDLASYVVRRRMAGVTS